MRRLAACAALALALVPALAAPSASAGQEGASAARTPNGPARPADGALEPRDASEPVAARARRRAERILAEPRFSSPDIPRPLSGPLEALGDAVLGALAWLALRLPGGAATVWALLAGAVLLIALAVATRLARRRAPPARVAEHGESGPAAANEDPRTLEREADRAERSGRLGLALRARFRAGLLRLDAAEQIALRPSLTTGEIARGLRSPEFDSMAATFEAVAYGGLEPERSTLEEQRSEWRALLGERAAR